MNSVLLNKSIKNIASEFVFAIFIFFHILFYFEWSDESWESLEAFDFNAKKSSPKCILYQASRTGS